MTAGVTSLEKIGGAGRNDAAVIIIGAGPVGLCLSLRLAGFGVRSIVLDRAATLKKQGSKACLIQGDVLEILDKIGCADPIAAEGVGWRVGHTYIKGVEIRRTEYPDRVGYPPFVNISQYRIEQELAAAAEASPLIELHWGAELLKIDQSEGEVRIHAQLSGRAEIFSARYAVGCDGVKSAVRDMIGAEWKGYRHKDRFLITDIKAKLPFEKERHFHYDSPQNPGRQLIIHPQPHDIWRIDWQLPPETDIDAERQDGRLDRRIRAVIGDIPYEIDWLSTYRFNQRAADPFRVGSVFLAGDAAHSLPPYGSRGMNSGLQDADNLAFKLGSVLSGQSDPDLLDSYHEERFAAALENLAVTEATIRFMVPPTPVHRAWRNLLLSASRHWPLLRRLVNSGKMAEPFHYPPSAFIAEGHEGAGSFAPDAPLTDGRRLRQLFGRAFIWTYLGDEARGAAEAMVRAGGPPAGVEAVVISTAPPRGAAPGESLSIDLAAMPTHHAAHLQPFLNSWFLVRPDGYVAAGMRGVEPSGLAALTRQCVANAQEAAIPLAEAG